MTSLESVTFGQTLTIEWWNNGPTTVGFDPRSVYVERFWLPVLGPSATWLLRYLAGRLASGPDAVTIDLAEAASALGLGDRTGRHAPFMRTVTRTIDFHLARLTEDDHFAIRRTLPPLSPRHLARLPQSLRQAHRAYLQQSEAHRVATPLETQGRQLALSLLALGESAEDSERQLVQWRFPSALAHSCVRFAIDEHERRRSTSHSDRKAS